MIKHGLRIWILAACVAVSGLAIGQNEEQPPQEELLLLREVEVASYHMPVPLDRLGKQATVIQGSALQDLPVQSVDDLLRYLPGIEVQQRGGFGVQGDISMRGSTFTQVLIMIDGMRLNDALTGHFNSYIPIVPSEIERIEVIKGAASAKFGADAAAGVVHIITKTFVKRPSQQMRTYGRIGMGEHNLLSAQAGVLIGTERGIFSAGIQTIRTDGQPLDSLEDAGFTLSTATLSGAHLLSPKWKVAARAAFDFRDFNARYFYTTSNFDQSRETVQSWWGHALLEGDFDQHSLQLNLSHKWLSDLFDFNPAFAPNSHKVTMTNLLAQDAWKLSNRIHLNLGGQVTHRSVRSTDRGNHEDWHQAIFAAANWDMGLGIMLNASLRADHDDNYDWEVTPQLDAAWQLNHWYLRASAGRSIRAADYTERHVSNGLPLVSPGRNLGNPDLNAERAWSLEAGIDYKLNDQSKVSATYFRRISDGLIDYVPTDSADIPNATNLASDGSYLFAQNLAGLTHEGLELKLEWVKSINAENQVRMTIGGMWVNIHADQKVVSKYLANAARFLGTFQGLWINQKWQLGITGIWKDRNADVAESIGANLVGQYTVWNLQASYCVQPSVSVFGQVQNVFNEEYQDFLGATMPRRWIMAGIKWDFSQIPTPKPRIDLTK